MPAAMNWIQIVTELRNRALAQGKQVDDQTVLLVRRG
jgi:hypothetical protein